MFDIVFLFSLAALGLTIMCFVSSNFFSAAMIGSYGVAGLAGWSFFKNLLNF